MNILDTILRRSGALVALAAVSAGCLFGLSSSSPASANPCLLGKPHQVGILLVCGDPPPPPDPTPAPPAPPPVSAGDVQALVAISNSFTGACAGGDTSCTVHLGIVGNYALVGFTDKANSGEYFLATNTSGSWAVIQKSGGWLIQSELQALTGLSATDAAQLEAAASANWP
jgi:hypothetical protein